MNSTAKDALTGNLACLAAYLIFGFNIVCCKNIAVAVPDAVCMGIVKFSPHAHHHAKALHHSEICYIPYRDAADSTVDRV